MAAVAGVLLALGGAAQAQTVFNHRGFDERHGNYSALPFESVDPASGGLTVVQTDLVLPGNAGLDLAITRVYNSKFRPNYESGDLTLEERSWVGIGWKLHFGRVINPTSTQSGATQIEMPDGSRHALYTTTAHPYGGSRRSSGSTTSPLTPSNCRTG